MKLPYDPVLPSVRGRFVGWSACQDFFRGRKVSLSCSYPLVPKNWCPRGFNMLFTVWWTYKCLAYYTMQRFCNINFSDRMRWSASWGNESEWVSARILGVSEQGNGFPINILTHLKRNSGFLFHDPIIKICKIDIHKEEGQVVQEKLRHRDAPHLKICHLCLDSFFYGNEFLQLYNLTRRGFTVKASRNHHLIGFTRLSLYVRLPRGVQRIYK